VGEVRFTKSVWEVTNNCQIGFNLFLFKCIRSNELRQSFVPKMYHVAWRNAAVPKLRSELTHGVEDI
jgi:hypothetical protein